jgi:H+/Cl- antiporter ClcA
VAHTPVSAIGEVDLQALLLAKILVAGVAFGLVALVFIELTHGIRNAFASYVAWPPLRPALGGVAVVALTYAVGSRDYLGLSLPLLTRSLAGGAGVIGAAFALKLLFTSITLGSGFHGGEVTPLFVIGATLGATLGQALHAPVPLFAAMGFLAVFAGAANTPIACTIMGVELFGSGAIVPFAVACVTAYISSSHRGIYASQRIGTPKAAGLGPAGDTATLRSVARSRRLWLPVRARHRPATHDEPGPPPSNGT